MKKVEAYRARMITFTKRKSGIYKKMNEIVSLCGVEVAFLVFSQAGKPHSFTNLSMEEMASRLKNPPTPEPSAQDKNYNTGPLIETSKKQTNENLMKQYVELLEEFEMEKEKMKFWEGSKNRKEIGNMWWNFTLEDLSVERLEKRHKVFLLLHKSLCDMAWKGKGSDDSSSNSTGHEHYDGGET